MKIICFILFWLFINNFSWNVYEKVECNFNYLDSYDLLDFIIDIFMSFIFIPFGIGWWIGNKSKKIIYKIKNKTRKEK